MEKEDTFEIYFDQEYEDSFPDEFLEAYEIIECLSAAEACDTLLVTQKGTEKKIVAKCYRAGSLMSGHEGEEPFGSIECDAVKVDAEDSQAGEELFIYKLNTKTGEYVMVSAKTYKVSNSGNVAVSMSKKATYELVTAEEAAKIDKQIKSTIKPKKSSAAIKLGKTVNFTLSSKANKENIKSITYKTSKKSVATISKSGKISAKGKGSVTVKAKITLKNGTTKTIKMTIKVK